ncbi:Kinesin motor domain [Trypanosoma vivax]|uniref:Kinesin-like protein n=1 Tax=Trypanosoma vivax (strain Y486) TaxID=1055687 RepID=G0U166_TRYVY|nr:kinesin [Trypanosoma vivax]KAH8609251.1 Kinesin motor domain [Trypanosoma vivax]KAH8620052.1 Kinesin motor domain [Trypanosoma vivax]CCC49821.1 kinesin. putative [Trypanosoma vivax Y486]
MATASPVTVGVRVRPKVEGALNAVFSSERSAQMACTVLSDTTLRISDNPNPDLGRTFTFAFDGVFDEETTQDEIYENLAMSAVDNVLSGTNATVLTYGQTGSGKTYTILGSRAECESSTEFITSDSGILLRALQDILHHASAQASSVHTVVGLSAVEIHLDKVRDLLSDSSNAAPLQISITRDIVLLPNVTYTQVSDLGGAVRAYLKASAKRTQRTTFANDESSRSHAIFSIEIFQQPITYASREPLSFAEYVSQRDKARVAQLERNGVRLQSHPLFSSASNPLFGNPEAPVIYSKLSLVDLAGSEKVRHSDIDDVVFTELKNINTSLTALGNVVHAIHTGSKHIPYRNSKLTSVLRDSFAAPNACIVLIVTVSPTVLTLNETLSSLHFADKMKMINVMPTTLNMSSSTCSETMDQFRLLLRTYEELVADLHIASCAHKFFVPQVPQLAMSDENYLLYDTIFRLRLPDSEARRMAIVTICDTLRTALGGKSEGLELSEEGKALHRELRDGIVRSWKQYAKTTYTNLNEVLEENDVIGLDEQRVWEETLENEITLYREARDTRRKLQQECDQLREGEQGNGKAVTVADSESGSQIEFQIEGSGDEPIENVDGHTDVNVSHEWEEDSQFWLQVTADAERIIELSKLRLEVSGLMLSNIRLLITLEEHQIQNQLVQERVLDVWRLSMAREVASGCASVYNEEESKRQHELGTLLARANVAGVGRAVHPFPYWMRRDTALGPKSRCNSNRRDKRKFTKFDDATLLEDIMSFMIMGGKIRKYDASGSAHQRLLYLKDKGGLQQLQWSVVGSLAPEGVLPVSSITNIFLGHVKEETKNTVCYQSFRITHRGKKMDAGAKEETLDFACDVLAEFEAWVIGIGQLTGLRPTFNEPMGLDKEQVAVGGLNESDLAFCVEWHILPSVYAEAQEQLIRRKRGSGLRLTPGELCILVRLDIFRSSAMWLRFYSEGLVVNPLPTLFCYVNAPQIKDASYLRV